MVFMNSWGNRIHRCPCTGPCRPQNASGCGGRFGGYGAVYNDRIPDTRLAYEAARALQRGNPVTIGLNEGGVLGIGTNIHYRPHSDGQTPYVRYVQKHNVRSNQTLANFASSDLNAIADDILGLLRRASFRVVAFADHLADRRYSEIHKQSIAYSVPVSSALTHVPIDQVACKLALPYRPDPWDFSY